MDFVRGKEWIFEEFLLGVLESRSIRQRKRLMVFKIAMLMADEPGKRDGSAASDPAEQEPSSTTTLEHPELAADVAFIVLNSFYWVGNRLGPFNNGTCPRNVTYLFFRKTSTNSCWPKENSDKTHENLRRSF